MISCDTCAVCALARAKYVCPRCSVKSCSLKCYDAHDGGRCSRGFRANEAREALRGARADDEGKRAMVDVLRRVRMKEEEEAEEEEEEEEEEDGGESPASDDEDETRCALSEMSLEALARGEMLTVDALDGKELASFKRACARGELVAPWTPWWMEKDVGETRLGASGERAVEEVKGDERREMSGSDSSAPSPATADEAFERFEILSRGKEPPASLRWHGVNALAAYVLVKRVFNGDWIDDEVAAASLLLDVSIVLRARTAIGGVECASSAMHDVVERAATLGAARVSLPPSSLPLALSTELAVIFSRGATVVTLALLDLSRVLIRASEVSFGEEKSAFRAGALKTRYLASYLASDGARARDVIPSLARACDDARALALARAPPLYPHARARDVDIESL